MSFGKVKKLLGGQVRLMVTASAPLAGEVLEFLKLAFCCPILEGYGLSETSGPVTFSKKEDPLSGTVGGPMMHTAIRLKDLPEMDYRVTDPNPRGEICVRSPCVTLGYFMRPDKTAETIDS
jgi:long-chain acyl-CoA synthetase